jgi:hypothetical protein
VPLFYIFSGVVSEALDILIPRGDVCAAKMDVSDLYYERFGYRSGSRGLYQVGGF